MIYSFSSFFQEDELLVDLKMGEMRGRVDRIVISEGTLTSSGRPKALNFPAKYRDDPKVLYQVLTPEMYNGCKTPWDRDGFQRDFPRRNVPLGDDDIAIVTDFDEVVDGRRIGEIAEETAVNGFVGLPMPCFYYYINAFHGVTSGAFAATGRIFREHDLSRMRGKAAGKPGFEDIPEKPKILSDCGWHFSYLGDPVYIKEKIGAAAHTEYDNEHFTDLKKIRNRMADLSDPFDRIGDNGEPRDLRIIEVDDSYPHTILRDIGRWSKYVR